VRVRRRFICPEHNPLSNEPYRKDMKYYTHARCGRRTLLASVFACGSLTLPLAVAQDDEDEIFELSPFTVDASDQSGYRATSTLAGTRIKTDLKDLGAAISVVTEEFLEDTGATSLEDLFQYTTSTEIGGVDGNYSAADLSAGGGRINQDENRREPQQGGRIRGLARPNFTRNYFTTSIPVERYNTSAITIIRGPNSLLFGLGSAGGVVDAGLGLAGIGNNKSTIRLRIDEYGTERAEYDFNRTLIEDRLAVKVSGLYEDKEYRQEEAGKLTKRFYGAFNAVLRKGEDNGLFGKTSLRGNVELGDEDMTPPDALPPILSWDSFFSPPQDFRPFSGIDYRQGFDTLNNGFRKWGTLDTRRNIADDGTITPGYFELSTPLHSTSHIFGQLGLAYGGDSGEGPSVLDGGSAVGFQGWINGGNGLPFTNPVVSTRSYFETDGSAGFKASSLQNADVFDFRNHLITGRMQNITKRFDSEMVSFEQILFGGRGGIEVTGGREFYEINRTQPFGGGGRNLPIYIDTSEYLSDNTPNPNVGRAFLLAQGDIDEWRSTQRENARATAFYNLDFEELSDGWVKWLGSHRFTGLFQEEDRVNHGVQYGKYWTGVGNTDFKTDVWGRPGNSNDLSFAGQTVQFAYISDDLRGVNEGDARLRPIDIDPLQDGDTFNSIFFDAQDREYRTGNFQVRRFARRGGVTNAGRTTVSSEALAWQSNLLGDHIVGLAGWRSDTIDTYGPARFRPRLGNNELDVDEALVVAENPNGFQKGNTFTWSIVGHLPQKYVDNLSGISSVSAHYGSSENFSAITQRNDINNNPIDNPNGTTEEFGLTLGFNEDKWNVRFTKYETSQALSRIGNDVSFTAVNQHTRALNSYQEALDRGQPFSVHQAASEGIESYDDLFARILRTIPAETQAIYNYALNPETREWESDGNIQGLSATTDVVAEGYEAELVGNPTNNWRISMNVAQTETIRSNTADATFAYATSVLEAIRREGLFGVNDSVGGIVTIGARYRGATIAPLVNQRAKDGTVSQEQREWRVNFVNNYNFTEGRLKGASIGGALRYQSGVATGYEVRVDELGNQVPILDRPFEGSDDINGDIWMAYKKKLGNGVNWKIQLNIRNIIGDQDLIPVHTNPDGVAAIFRIPPDRTWFLTNTFSF